MKPQSQYISPIKCNKASQPEISKRIPRKSLIKRSLIHLITATLMGEVFSVGLFNTVAFAGGSGGNGGNAMTGITYGGGGSGGSPGNNGSVGDDGIQGTISIAKGGAGGGGGGGNNYPSPTTFGSGGDGGDGSNNNFPLAGHGTGATTSAANGTNGVQNPNNGGGGAGGGGGGAGGTAAVIFNTSINLNAASYTGQKGGNGGNGGNASSGVTCSGGGGGGGGGGDAIIVNGFGTITTGQTYLGGNGGNGGNGGSSSSGNNGFGGNGGGGGDGIHALTSFNLTNTGTIQGGNGGTGGTSVSFGNGATGGAGHGVYCSGSGNIINSGTIKGGNGSGGGYGIYGPSSGGLSVTNSGEISGSSAIWFQGSNNTLTLQPGYSFPSGNVVCQSGTANALDLKFSGSFTLPDIGALYQNFSDFTSDPGPGSTLTVSGAAGGSAGKWTIKSGTLTLNDTSSSLNASQISLNTSTIYDISRGPSAPSLSNITTVTGSKINLGNLAVTLTGANSTIGGDLADGGASGLNGASININLTPGNTVIFQGNNTYSGETGLQSGTLSVASPSNLGTGGINFKGGTLALSNVGPFAFSKPITMSAGGGAIDIGSAAVTFSGTMTGSSNLAFTGASGVGSLEIVSSSPTFTGDVTVSQIPLNLTTSDGLGTGNITFNTGSSLNLTGSSLTVPNPIELGAPSLTISNTVTNSTSTLSGGITDSGASNLIINASGGKIHLKGASSIASTTIAAGSLVLGDSTTSLASNITVDTGATYDISLGSSNPAMSSVNTVAGSNINLGNVALTLTGAGTIPGNFLDSGTSGLNGASININLTPGDTIVFQGNNTYSGGTGLQSGTLSVASPSNLGTSGLTFEGGTLALSNTGSFAFDKPISMLAGGGTIDVGSATATFSGVMTGPSSLAFTGTSGVGSVEIASSNPTFEGDVTVSQIPLTLTVSNGLGLGNITFNTGSSLNLTGSSLTVHNPIRLGAASLTISNTVANSASILAGGVSDSGASNLTINNASGGEIYFLGASSIASTTIATGSLILGDSATSLTSDITIDAGATYDISLGSSNPAMSSVNTVAGSNINLGDIALTLTGAGTIPGNFLDSGASGLDGASININLTPGNTVVFQGNNTYSGGTGLQSGTLSVASPSNLGTGRLNFEGGTLQAANSLSLSQDLILHSGGGTVDANGHTFTLSGTVQGANSLNFVSSAVGGSVVLSTGGDTSGTLAIGSSGYANPVALIIADQANLPNAFVNLAAANASLDISPAQAAGGGTTTVNIGSLSGSAGDIILGNNTLYVNTTGSKIYSGDLQSAVVSGIGTFMNGGNGDLLLAGVLSDGGLGGRLAVAQSGSGSLTLSSNNTFSGGATISGGKIIVGHNNALGSNTVTFNSASGTATLQVLTGSPSATDIPNNLSLNTDGYIDANGNSFTLSGNISQPNTLVISDSVGGAVTRLTGVNTHAGTKVSGTTLVFDNYQALGTNTVTLEPGAKLVLANNITSANPVPTAINLEGNSTLNNGGFTGYFNSPITGLFNLTFQGGGMTVIGGANRPASTTIASGVLALDSGASLANSITIDTGATYDISKGATNPVLANVNSSVGSNINLGNQNLILSSGTIFGNLLDGGLSGATRASITKIGSGAATLSGNNTYSNGTILQEGTLIAANTNALGNGGDITFAGGTLQFGGSYTINNNLSLAANQNSPIDLNNNDVTLNGRISGGGSVFALTNSGGIARTLALNGTNTASGTISIGADVILALNGNATIANSSLSFADPTSTFDIHGITPDALTIGDLDGAQGQVTLGNKNLIFGTASNGANFAGIIQGNGYLTKAGSGKATLSGINTYTQGTTITDGTLSISSIQALGTGPVKLEEGTTLLLALNIDPLNPLANPINLTGNSTIDTAIYTGYLANPITGAFDLTIQGNMLFIEGVNAPASTTIASGTLALNTGARLSNPITLNSGTTLDLSNGAANPILANVNSSAGSNINLGNQSVTFTSGTIRGKLLDGGLSGATGASIIKTGPGTLSLFDINTYSNGTTHQGGKIVIGTPKSLGTGQLIFGTDGAMLQIGAPLNGAINNPIVLTANGLIDTQEYNVTLAGIISGGSALQKRGSGSLAITGVNTQNGIILEEGTIVLGNDNGLGAGNFTFSGSRTVLQAAAPLSNVANSIILAADGIIDTAGNNVTFSGSFTGLAGFTKKGNGTLILTNPNNSYLGATLVKTDELKVNGALTNSAVTVANGARLSGNASVYSLINLGTVKPGNSIGQITVKDTFDNTRGIYGCEINDAGQSDLIQVNGTATLNGALNVIPQPGNYDTSKTYVILTASNLITTQFNTVTSSSALLKYTLKYLTNQVELTATKSTNLGDIILKGNPRIVAEYIDRLNPSPGSGLDNLKNIFPSLDLDNLYNLLNQLHPAANIMVSAEIATLELTQADEIFSALLFDRSLRRLKRKLNTDEAQAAQFGFAVTRENISLNRVGLESFFTGKAPSSSMQDHTISPQTQITGPQNKQVSYGQLSLWLQQSISHINHTSISDGSPTIGIPGVRMDINKTLFGVDAQVTDQVLLGATLGYSKATYALREHYGKGNINSYRIGLYGMWMPTEDWYLNGVMFYTRHFFKGNRDLILSTGTYSNEQEHQGNQVSALVEMGRDIALSDQLTLTPYGSLGGLYLKENGYTETAQGLNPSLKANNHGSRFIQGKGGVELSHLFKIKDILLFLYGKAGYIYRKNLGSPKAITASFADYGDSFTVFMDNSSQNMVNAGAGITATLNNNLSISGTYNGEISSSRSLHQGIIRLDYKF